MVATALSLTDRLKDSRGRYPVQDASVGTRNKRPEIRFAFKEHREQDAAPLSLESLAGCIVAGDQEPDQQIQNFLQLATECGPLFGQANDELVSDWQCAAALAREAIALQEQVNGHLGLKLAQDTIVKQHVFSADSSAKLFTLYTLSVRIARKDRPSRYAPLLPAMPWQKTFSTQDDHVYAFVLPGEDDECLLADLCLVSSEQELDTATYAAIVCALSNDDISGEQLLSIGISNLAIDQEEAAREAERLGRDNSIRVQDDEISKDDVKQLQRIVQVLIAMHVSTARLDLFETEGSDDFLIFDSLISSLWYDFARHLRAVKVAYCQRCGKGFSLTGHRGMPRRYCSSDCRMKDKNDRNRKMRDAAREMFLEGASVNEIARSRSGGTASRPAIRSIASQLAQSRALQQALREEAARGSDELATRCLDEGIFDEKRILQFRKQGQARSRSQR